MSDDPVWPGYVSKGKVVIIEREAAASYARRFEGQNIEMVIRRRRMPVSDEQRGYYFGVIVKAVADHTGHSREESHELIKEHCLKFYEDPADGSERAVLYRLLKALDVLDIDEIQRCAIQAKQALEFDPVVRIGSITELHTSSFEEFTERARQWAATELGISIQTPNEPG